MSAEAEPDPAQDPGALLRIESPGVRLNFAALYFDNDRVGALGATSLQVVREPDGLVVLQGVSEEGPKNLACTKREGRRAISLVGTVQPTEIRPRFLVPVTLWTWEGSLTIRRRPDQRRTVMGHTGEVWCQLVSRYIEFWPVSAPIPTIPEPPE